MRNNISRRSFIKQSAWATAAGSAMFGASAMAGPRLRTPKGPTAKQTFALPKQGKKIPVIFDTDIGNDIDDTWALVLMLKSPEFDVKLITTDSGNDVYRARIVAKLLEVAGRTDIPIGIGIGKADEPGPQSGWVGDYRLSDYPGKVHEDGTAAMVETIRRSDDPVSLVCVGPVPNLPVALRRDPSIAERARFVGMHGSVRRGYGGSPEISAEYNVKADPKALQGVFAAPWDITITPLDTCGLVHLTGEKFKRVYEHKDPLVQALMANYRVWRNKPDEPVDASSILFDTVAVYLALSEQLLRMEDLPIRVADDGRTLIDRTARSVHSAMSWKDLGAFEDFLVQRLTADGKA